MYQKVLFPTDFSIHSQRINGLIGKIPGIKEVVLFHVVEVGGSLNPGTGERTEIGLVKSLMEEHKKIIEALGIAVKIEIDIMDNSIFHGNIGSRVQEKAESEKVSMIVMGARGKSLHDLALGSVSTYVLHHTTIPLLLVKSPQAPETVVPADGEASQPVFSKVLIPTDFSTPADEVMRFVKGMQGINEIILLHVIEKEKNDPLLQEYISGATKKLGIIRDELVQAGFTVKDHVLVGYPPDEIILLARQEHATLIVMSPLGEGWLRELKELFVGGTTYAVAWRADTPILVVRPVQKV